MDVSKSGSVSQKYVIFIWTKTSEEVYSEFLGVLYWKKQTYVYIYHIYIYTYPISWDLPNSNGLAQNSHPAGK